MFPYITLFGKVIGMYAVMSLIGMFAAGAFAMGVAKKREHNNNIILTMLLVAAIGALLGAHLLYGIVNLKAVITYVIPIGIHSFSDLLIVIKAILGGTVFYGGLLGGLLFGTIYLRRKKLPLGEYADMSAPCIPLFHGFGRIGCFLGGCCYGIEWEHGIVFRRALVDTANGTPRLPVQLCEAAFNFALFFVLWHLQRHGKLRGKLMAVYLIAYPSGRFLLEFLRGDSYRGFWLTLSTSQIISLGIIAFTQFYLMLRSGHSDIPKETI